jgi:ComF family protein
MSVFAGKALDALACMAGRRCQFCSAVLDDSRTFPLCPACSALLAPRPGGYCPACGTCFDDPASAVSLCLACRMSPPPWTGMAFHGPYEGALRDLVHRHKFDHDLGLGALLSRLIRQAWELRAQERPGMILPVPMMPGPVFRRGFNQSAELARMLGRHLGLRPVLSGLRKLRETCAQSSLGRAARSRNVTGAFAADACVRGRHILIVDDVMTTGATLGECARACLEAGAVRVDVFVLARAQ